tara:strand:+ start:1563 stop:3389 length:1827 start_codon:yes stop_codon:yes gene_type:complete
MKDFTLNPDLQLGTVFETNGTSIKVALSRNLKELSQSHNGTVYAVGQIGSLIKLHIGRTILFAMVRMLRLQTDEEQAAQDSIDTFDRRVLEADLFGEARWVGSKSQLSFDRGVRTYPLPMQPVFLVTAAESRELYTAIEKNRSLAINNLISFGNYVGAVDVPCHADMDKFFGQHCAVLGSTGSGKSTAVAAVLHSGLDHEPTEEGTCSPRIIIIDPHGEYGSAFGGQCTVFRSFDDGDGDDGTLVKLPYWLMSSDEFRQLIIGKTEFEATSQANVVYKALSHARMRAADLVLAANDGARFETADHPDLPMPINDEKKPAIASFNRDRPLPFSLAEFEAHITECQAKRYVGGRWVPVTDSEFQKSFASIIDKLRVLRTDSRIAFLMSEYVKEGPDLDAVLAQFLAKIDAKPNEHIRILDISGLPNEVAGPLTAALARLLFSYKLHQTRDERERDPILLVCEEAHRYVPNRGEAQYTAAQESIRRIAREGRKYGIGLMLVSQRPADIESTVLSQCNSWLVLRLTNGADQEHVARFLPDTLSGLIKLLPSLPRREALFVGEAAAMPARIRLKNVPDGKRPQSADISFAEGWSNEAPEAAALAGVVARMQKF